MRPNKGDNKPENITLWQTSISSPDETSACLKVIVHNGSLLIVVKDLFFVTSVSSILASGPFDGLSFHFIPDSFKIY